MIVRLTEEHKQDTIQLSEQHEISSTELCIVFYTASLPNDQITMKQQLYVTVIKSLMTRESKVKNCTSFMSIIKNKCFYMKIEV